MITATITAREYEALAEQFSDIQITETEGLLITRAFVSRYGYVLAFQPFAGRSVTLIWECDVMPTGLNIPGRPSASIFSFKKKPTLGA